MLSYYPALNLISLRYERILDQLHLPPLQIRQSGFTSYFSKAYGIHCLLKTETKIALILVSITRLSHMFRAD